MATILKGVATVFGITGSAAITGGATFASLQGGADFSHEYDKTPVKDGQGKVVGYGATDGLVKGKLTFTPTGANIAAAEADLDFTTKLARVTLTLFKQTSLNHARWICTSSKPILKQGDHATFELEIECSEDSATDLSTVVT